MSNTTEVFLWIRISLDILHDMFYLRTCWVIVIFKSKGASDDAHWQQWRTTAARNELDQDDTCSGVFMGFVDYRI